MHGCGLGIARFLADILLDYEMETALIEEFTDHVQYIKVTHTLCLPTSAGRADTHSFLTATVRK